MARAPESLARFCADPNIPQSVKGFMIEAVENVPYNNPLRSQLIEELLTKSLSGINAQDLGRLLHNFAWYAFRKYAAMSQALDVRNVLLSIGDENPFELGAYLCSDIRGTLVLGRLPPEIDELPDDDPRYSAIMEELHRIVAVELLECILHLVRGADPDKLADR